MADLEKMSSFQFWSSNYVLCPCSMKILLTIESPKFCISLIPQWLLLLYCLNLTLSSNTTSSSVPLLLTDPTFLEGLHGYVMSYSQCLYVNGNTNKLCNVYTPIFLFGHRFGCMCDLLSSRTHLLYTGQAFLWCIKSLYKLCVSLALLLLYPKALCYHGFCCLNSYIPKLPLAEVLIFSLMFSEAPFVSLLWFKFSKAAKVWNLVTDMRGGIWAEGVWDGYESSHRGGPGVFMNVLVWWHCACNK